MRVEVEVGGKGARKVEGRSCLSASREHQIDGISP